ncbi:MAG: flagellar motor switch protein FliM [Defluviitaleaceae bacterium]|nr:flagellar motor switch protein FliM [Defluviitaleaceae bacterium]
MGDVLTQEEIDALLEAVKEGEANTETNNAKTKTAMKYDFARPQKINKEQSRTLQIMHEAYCRNLASFMSAYLNTNVSISVSAAEQVAFSEFTSALSNPVILAICEFSPLKGSVMLELSSDIGYAIIESLAGGVKVGKPNPFREKSRDFTEMEKGILAQAVNKMLEHLPESWEAVEKITPRLEKIETNYQFAQIISPSDMTALVTITIKIGGVDGRMNFCLPIAVIEPIIERLNTRYWFSQSSDTRDSRYIEDLQNKIEVANIDVSAVIGRTRISFWDLVNLNVGDVMPLDSYVSSDLEVYVGKLRKFYAKPGISRGKNAIQITSLIKKEENTNGRLAFAGGD